MTARRKCDSMVLVASRLDLRATLDTTSGTVTDILEQLVGETIDAHAHDHRTVEADRANDLHVEVGEPLLHRAATLRGRTSGRSYVYAESIIVARRLPAEFCQRLQAGTDPIGRIFGEMGIPVSRDGAGWQEGVPPPNLGVEIGEAILCRTYRIDSEQIPVMMITEWFFDTLVPFLR